MHRPPLKTMIRRINTLHSRMRVLPRMHTLHRMLRCRRDDPQRAVIPLHSRPLLARPRRQLAVHVRASKLPDTPLTLLVIHACHATEMIHHNTLTNIVHGAGYRARVHRHVWPADRETADNGEGHG